MSGDAARAQSRKPLLIAALMPLTLYDIIFINCYCKLLLNCSLNDLRITEIHYHPSGDEETLEFIEVENVGEGFLDLAGVRFIEGVRFTFPPDTLLAPGDQLVVSRLPMCFLG